MIGNIRGTHATPLIDYGTTPGQLTELPKGEGVDAIISSPPYAETILNDDQRQAGKYEKLRWGTNEEYGMSAGQLGTMKEEEGVDACHLLPTLRLRRQCLGGEYH